MFDIIRDVVVFSTSSYLLARIQTKLQSGNKMMKAMTTKQQQQQQQ